MLEEILAYRTEYKTCQMFMAKLHQGGAWFNIPQWE